MSNVVCTFFACYTDFLSVDKILEGHSNSIRPRREVEKGQNESVDGSVFQVCRLAVVVVMVVV